MQPHKKKDNCNLFFSRFYRIAIVAIDFESELAKCRVIVREISTEFSGQQF